MRRKVDGLNTTSDGPLQMQIERLSGSIETRFAGMGWQRREGEVVLYRKRSLEDLCFFSEEFPAVMPISMLVKQGSWQLRPLARPVACARAPVHRRSCALLEVLYLNCLTGKLQSQYEKYLAQTTVALATSGCARHPLLGMFPTPPLASPGAGASQKMQLHMIVELSVAKQAIHTADCSPERNAPQATPHDDKVLTY